MTAARPAVRPIGRPLAVLFAMVALLLAFTVAVLVRAEAEPVVVTVQPAVTFQTISGWEATAQAGEIDSPAFDRYREELLDRAVTELGLNRVRLELRSGAENPRDYAAEALAGRINEDEFKRRRYEAVNDNGDPLVAAPGGFHFSALDHTVDNVVQPLRERLARQGESLYLVLTYVDFGSSPFEHKDAPAEYAELVLVTFQHLERKYGWVPDAWEVILEPDTERAGWSPAQVGRALAAAGERLEASGYRPAFIAPSTTDMGNAGRYFDEMIRLPGVAPYVKELAYHRYGGVTDANLQGIAQRAAQFGLRTSMLEHIGSGHEDLHRDLTVAGVSAWQQFTLAFPTEDNGAQYFVIDDKRPDRPTVTLARQARYLQQYFKHIRRGAVRLQAVSSQRNVQPVAFRNVDGSVVVVVASGSGATIAVEGLPPGKYGVRYTTERETNADGGEAASDGPRVTASLPDAGVVTFFGRS